MSPIGKSPRLLVAGVDEAGRGPLAGPVYAAAVVLNYRTPVAALADSKKLSGKRRSILEKEIKERALCWSVGVADVAEIDRLNILWASMLAMQRAVAGLPVRPYLVLVDGNRCPDIDIACEAVIGGDAKVAQISAASILAKVGRDRFMCRLHESYPDYGFDRHKGYPTRVHLQALQDFGVTPYHRASFAPFKRIIKLNKAVS
jgi:ribonuclease HII